MIGTLWQKKEYCITQNLRVQPPKEPFEGMTAQIVSFKAHGEQ